MNNFLEGCNPGDGSAKNQGLDNVCSLLRVDHLDIYQMMRKAKLIAYTVTAQHISSLSSDVQGLTATIAFHNARQFDPRHPLVFHPPQTERACGEQKAAASFQSSPTNEAGRQVYKAAGGTQHSVRPNAFQTQGGVPGQGPLRIGCYWRTLGRDTCS